MKFNELKIGNEILRAIDDLGYEKPSPIQEESIPHLLEGYDLIGKSQTGSGKTAAFAIPIIEKIEANGISQALILCPTRELCIQVSKEIKSFVNTRKKSEFFQSMVEVIL